MTDGPSNNPEQSSRPTAPPPAPASDGPSAPGTPQIFALHGFLGLPRSFDRVRAGSDWHWHTPTLTGHGLQPVLRGAHFDDEVTALAERARRLPAPRHLLGYSMGARVGLGLLRYAPELFSSATLIGVNPGLVSADERAHREQQESSWQTLLRQQGLQVFLDHFARLAVFANQSALAEGILAEQHSIRKSHTAEGLRHALSVLGLASMPDYLPTLQGVDLPVTLLVGELDEKFSRLGADLAQRLPAGRLELVPGAGHNLLLEAPEVVRQTLASQVAGQYVI